MLLSNDFGLEKKKLGLASFLLRITYFILLFKIKWCLGI